MPHPASHLTGYCIYMAKIIRLTPNSTDHSVSKETCGCGSHLCSWSDSPQQHYGACCGHIPYYVESFLGSHLTRGSRVLAL
ncbi:hypothetical protein GDO78_013960 [Eleutherodactylus coqui]|uniref:Uncharacterized protein n=1 Tax=Eleutherodactylus coqui TaxID=57060 RepID=A0A8J6EF35_ELECQ|nr:hypothetical protein GDO78_013960 [Eleutherodactylus coqui]